MGVQGWNLLLTEHGWLPFVDLSQAASTSAFLSSEEELLEQSNRSSKAASSTHIPFDRIQAIPSNAELYLDGVCVCFQIHSVAYARHRQQVLGGNNSSSNSRRTKTTTANHLTAAQIRHLMPCFLPTDLLTQVTLEFLETLLQENRNVKVYWDGDLRYAPPVLTDKDENDSTATDPAPMFFKQDTELSRQSKRQDEWSNLQRYCEQGRLPSAQEWPLVQWERAFPKTRLFISQVMAAMVGNQNNRFEMIFCQEEADALMAKSVSGNTNAYIVGLDSDFCFFPDVNYIPIHTLIHDEYDKQLKAIILRRDTIAASLELPHERLMVELAMLMGNDYVSQDDEIASRALGMDVAKKMQKGKLMSKTKAAIAFLKQQSEDFQLECNNHPQLQACMDFCRNVYNLQDMSEYAMEEAVSGEAENGLIPLVHESLREELKEAVVDPELDDSFQDAVIRYVEKIAENAGRIVDQNQEADDTPTLDFTSEQLETFRQVVACRTAPDATPPTPVMIDQDIIRDDKWRPAWEDVAAAYWIERIISKVYANTLEQQGVAINHLKLDAPGNIFDSYLFYAMMRVARNKLQPAVTEKPPAMEEEPRLKLPVDEFESTILESVRKNRVTIIQGETGCGMLVGSHCIISSNHAIILI